MKQSYDNLIYNSYNALKTYIEGAEARGISEYNDAGIRLPFKLGKDILKILRRKTFEPCSKNDMDDKLSDGLYLTGMSLKDFPVLHRKGKFYYWKNMHTTPLDEAYIMWPIYGPFRLDGPEEDSIETTIEQC